MLALTRRINEEVVIGDPDNPLGVIRVVSVHGDKVRLSFDFPRDIKINRSELADQKKNGGDSSNNTRSPAKPTGPQSTAKPAAKANGNGQDTDGANPQNPAGKPPAENQQNTNASPSDNDSTQGAA